MNRSARILACWVMLAGLLGPQSSAALTINEVFYDAVGADDGKVFIELFGTPGLMLDGFILEGVNGAGGAIGPVLRLEGALGEDGFFVLADRAADGSSLPEATQVSNFDLQNGPDSLVLRDSGGRLLDAVGYGVFGAGESFAGEGSPAPDAPPGRSIARRFPGLDTDDNAADFVILATPTPGGALAVPEPASTLLLLPPLMGWLVSRFGRRVDPPGPSA